MGCCQTRERPMSLKRNEAFALTQCDEVICTRECLEFIEERESLEDWEEILKYSLVNVAEVQERCFQVLETNIGEHKKKIIETFVRLVPSMLSLVKASDMSQRKNSLKLIKLLIEKTERLEEVLQQNIFNCALRFFICNDPDLRMLAAGTCHVIFAKNCESQKLFFNMNGIFMFLHMILLSTNDQIKLGVLLDYFIDLILDSDGELNPFVFKYIGNIEIYYILRELRKQTVSGANSYRINQLISVLFETNLKNKSK